MGVTSASNRGKKKKKIVEVQQWRACVGGYGEKQPFRAGPRFREPKPRYLEGMRRDWEDLNWLRQEKRKSKPINTHMKRIRYHILLVW